ncbi:hypothetical protein FA95DRAFT_1486839 [Auriscalpium vulgare]|uniref:Uncharacterized protein n=1 Tax=Auriscalpium vulgare TaxID=40419 RepID=A0ACB8S2R2_9AGAM|nr:hypothetical protein FA95DRAFT_1486839 [Auriscalpium vulgare]
MAAPLPPTAHYIRFSLAPACADALLVRRAIQDALTQSFGLTASSTYLDILWVADSGEEAVVRTGVSDAARVMAATAVYAGRMRLSVVKESSFLPSLSADGPVV